MTKLFTAITFFTITISSNVFAADIVVFSSNTICFVDTVDQGDVKVLDNGRIIHRTINLPEKTTGRKITATLRIKSAGDPWDRFGSVFIVRHDEPNIEVVKFMTGFGTGRQDVELHPTVNRWADYSEWEVDISLLDVLLQGEVTIGAMIDTWVNPGWELSLSINFVDDETSINPSKIIPVFNTTGQYAGYEFFRDTGLGAEFTLPDNFREVVLVVYVSGHGGTYLGDEFHPKHNVIYLNGAEKFRFIPWRSDCGQFREFNPTSAKWEGDIWSSDLSRSGWCPGDVVEPSFISLTGITPGKHSISYNIENQSEIELNYWNIVSFVALWD